MRKQLGIFTSLLFLCATAFLWVSCSSNRCCDDRSISEPSCQPVNEQPCQPVCPPQCNPTRPPPVYQPVCPPPACLPTCPPLAYQPEFTPTYSAYRPECPPSVYQPLCPPPCPEPLCRPAPRCHYPTSNELCCRDGIIVSAKNPGMCMLGDQYPLELDIKACDDVCDVVVTTHLPEGVTFIRSQPEAKVDGRKLTWNIGPMKKGDCRPAKVWVKCECEGEQCACFCATAVPVRFCSLLCAKPVLTCEKHGPDEVCPGDPVHYTITVTNRGSCTAEDVVVTDNVPEGLEHSSCIRTLTYKIGSLEPCQTKKIDLCFTAVKRGKICNTAVVTACNADSVSCQWCTCI
ncbi:MAG: DUF11 domain-containing protein, partial [Parachlamydiaceae bacterium]|nr:DUF11 domain-containing protein [Parachlamydiaceae bacterium]